MSARTLRLAVLAAVAILAASARVDAQSVSGGPGNGTGAGGYQDELDRPYEEKKPDPPKAPVLEPEPEKKGPPEVTFFDNRVRTKKVLYIIDRSGSMTIRDQNEIVDGSTIVSRPMRLDVAKAETKRSIDGLDKSIDFNVIAFSSGSTVSSGGGFLGWLFGAPPAPAAAAGGAVIQWKDKTLVPGDEPNRKAAIGWVSKITDNNATDAKSAFVTAFDHKPVPETMFFLSDGIPNVNGGPNEVRSYVKGRNSSGKTVVHTIWIGERSAESETFMSGLARDNNGSFTRR